jgi:hypothetical protein
LRMPLADYQAEIDADSQAADERLQSRLP